MHRSSRTWMPDLACTAPAPMGARNGRGSTETFWDQTQSRPGLRRGRAGSRPDAGPGTFRPSRAVSPRTAAIAAAVVPLFQPFGLQEAVLGLASPPLSHLHRVAG